MPGEAAVDAVRLFVALVAAAAFVAVVARRLRVPYTVALVVFGLGVGAAAGTLDVALTPSVFLAVLLPGLVFEAALRTELEHLRPALLGVALLAVPGVLLGAVITALILVAATGLDPRLAFVVGAIVSATDPAAVIATFRELRAPRALATLVEAESVFNDGTGIVLFAIGISAIAGGTTPASGILAFTAAIGVSAVIGLVVGYAGSRLIAVVADHLVGLSLTVVVAYGTYLLAEALHVSGIIATVVAGLVVGSYGRTHGMSARTEEAVETVWDFVAFLMTALIFLLVGVAITIADLVAALPYIVWGVAGVLVARAFIVYGLLGGAARIAHPLGLSRGLPLPWLHILFWSGLRGAVAVALALSLPPDFPQRGLIQGTAFGIVLFTLLVQGTTAGRLLARLRLREAAPEAPSAREFDTPV